MAEPSDHTLRWHKMCKKIKRSFAKYYPKIVLVVPKEEDPETGRVFEAFENIQSLLTDAFAKENEEDDGKVDALIKLMEFMEAFESTTMCVAFGIDPLRYSKNMYDIMCYIFAKSLAKKTRYSNARIMALLNIACDNKHKNCAKVARDFMNVRGITDYGMIKYVSE